MQLYKTCNKKFNINKISFAITEKLSETKSLVKNKKNLND